MITARAGRLLVAALLLWAPLVCAEQKADAIDAFLSRFSDLQALNGAVLVADGGKVIYRKGFGQADFEWGVANTPDTRFRLASVSKQFTAAVILQLVQEGKFTLDTTLAEALPSYRKDTGAKVTIHHLLNHTSGIPSYTSLPAFASDISRDPYGVKEFVEKYCSGDLEFEPGSTFRYNNSGYFILGAIIEQATGTSYETAVADRLFRPLGMRSSGYDRSGPVIEKRARGYERSLGGVRNADYLDMSLPYAAGSLYSTVEDLFLWDQALYGDTIVPAALKARMFTPGLEGYGYGWGIAERPIGPGKAMRTHISHGGGINGFNTLIVRVPEDRHLVVLLNNTGGTSLGAMSAGVLDILYGRTPPLPKRPVSHLLYETLGSKGVEAAIAQYHELKKTRANEVDFGERFLNELGYELMRGGRLDDAIEILKLNVEAFPGQSNPYDSLGEAYMKAGQNELAIKNYAKSLELNPANRHAVEQLAVLTKR
ncbi:MAG: serine hydrolase [Vicinamibacteraceae bacterium]|nr:serine hydrolase [Vicinamibacteraceae bacterium]